MYLPNQPSLVGGGGGGWGVGQDIFYPNFHGYRAITATPSRKRIDQEGLVGSDAETRQL